MFFGKINADKISQMLSFLFLFLKLYFFHFCYYRNEFGYYYYISCLSFYYKLSCLLIMLNKCFIPARLQLRDVTKVSSKKSNTLFMQGKYKLAHMC